MDSLQNMRVFLLVAETGSFTAAAARLKISRTLATRHIMQLEQTLGARLLNRTTRRISLTSIGEAYLERISPALNELEAAREVADAQTRLATGMLRINAPMSLGATFLGPAIAQFLEENPKLRIDLTLNDRRVDLTEEGYDLAIRVTPAPNQSDITRPITYANLGVFASRHYVSRFGEPLHPKELHAEYCFAYSYLPTSKWTLRDPQNGKEIAVPIGNRLSANNGDLLAAAAAQGLGVVHGPYFTVWQALRDAGLVPILRPFWPEPLSVYAVLPSRKFQPIKVRSFIDFLSHKWGSTPPWEAP
jgi:DNA-binding transcriptional LysR family regulator